MRTALAVTVLCLTASPPALARPAQPAASPAACAAELARVKAAEPRRLFREYPDALWSLAQAYQASKLSQQAIATAHQAAEAYDRQLELRHEFSESTTDAARGRAERAAARELGLARDRARYFAAGVAEAQGLPDEAVTDYLLVVRSQPGEGLGLDALAGLKALGWLAPPASPAPVVAPPAVTP